MKCLLIILLLLTTIITGCTHKNPYQDKGLTAVGEYVNSMGMEFIEMPGGYYVSKYETRQSEFESIMGYNPSTSKGENLPVEHVSTDEALKFCDKLTKLEKMQKTLLPGMVYVLPSYEEWLEYVADASLSGANIEHYIGEATATKNVDSGDTNRLGLFCVRGNVSEFSRDISPTTACNIILGANFMESRDYRLMQTHKASYVKRSQKSLHIGFRVVLIPEEKNVSVTRKVGINPNE